MLFAAMYIAIGTTVPGAAPPTKPQMPLTLSPSPSTCSVEPVRVEKVDLKSDTDPLERARREATSGSGRREGKEPHTLLFVIGSVVALGLGALGWHFYSRHRALQSMQAAGATLSTGGVPLTGPAARGGA